MTESLPAFPEYEAIAAPQLILAASGKLKALKALSQEKIAESLSKFMERNYESLSLGIKTIDQQTYSRLIARIRKNRTSDMRLMRALWIWLHVEHSDIVEIAKNDLANNWSVIDSKNYRVLESLKGHFAVIAPNIFEERYLAGPELIVSSLLCGVTSENISDFKFSTIRADQFNDDKSIKIQGRGRILIYDQIAHLNGIYEGDLGTFSMTIFNIQKSVNNTATTADGILTYWLTGQPPVALPIVVARTAGVRTASYHDAQYFIGDIKQVYQKRIQNLLEMGGVSLDKVKTLTVIK